MISIEKETPEVYYKLSRDFQLLGRLYEVVLNSVKTNSDMIYALPHISTVNSRIVDLFMVTLGFKARHNYNVDQLAALSTIFLTLLKNKGTLYAIELAGNTVLNVAGSSEKIRYIVKDGEIKIYIPAGLTDTSLFYDILTYILPAGMTCSIVKAVIKNETRADRIYVQDNSTTLGVADTKTAIIKEVDNISDKLEYNPEVTIETNDLGELVAIAEGTAIGNTILTDVNGVIKGDN